MLRIKTKLQVDNKAAWSNSLHGSSLAYSTPMSIAPKIRNEETPSPNEPKQPRPPGHPKQPEIVPIPPRPDIIPKETPEVFPQRVNPEIQPNQPEREIDPNKSPEINPPHIQPDVPNAQRSESNPILPQHRLAA